MAQTITEHRIAIALSREELLLVMRLLDIATLPGFDQDWVEVTEGGALTAKTLAILEAAGNGLAARGYLVPDALDTAAQPRIGLNDQLIALLMGCANPTTSLLFETLSSQRAATAQLHWNGIFGVAHTQPIAGVHLFEMIETHAQWLEGAAELLHLNDQPSGTLQGTLQIDALDVARAAAQRFDAAATIAALTQGGLSVECALALGQAMADPTALAATVLGLQHGPDDQWHGKFDALVVTPAMCFMLRSATLGGDTLTVQQVAATAIRLWLATPAGRDREGAA